jgi:hypothetical protein
VAIGESLMWLLGNGVVDGVEGGEEAREGLGGKVQVEGCWYV